MSEQDSFDQSNTTTTDETAEPGKTNKGQTGEIKPPTRINIDEPVQEDESIEEGTGATAGGS